MEETFHWFGELVGGNPVVLISACVIATASAVVKVTRIRAQERIALHLLKRPPPGPYEMTLKGFAHLDGRNVQHKEAVGNTFLSHGTERSVPRFPPKTHREES